MCACRGSFHSLTWLLTYCTVQCSRDCDLFWNLAREQTGGQSFGLMVLSEIMLLTDTVSVALHHMTGSAELSFASHISRSSCFLHQNCNMLLYLNNSKWTYDMWSLSYCLLSWIWHIITTCHHFLISLLGDVQQKPHILSILPHRYVKYQLCLLSKKNLEKFCIIKMYTFLTTFCLKSTSFLHMPFARSLQRGLIRSLLKRLCHSQLYLSEA